MGPPRRIYELSDTQILEKHDTTVLLTTLEKNVAHSVMGHVEYCRKLTLGFPCLWKSKSFSIASKGI